MQCFKDIWHVEDKEVYLLNNHVYQNISLWQPCKYNFDYKNLST